MKFLIFDLEATCWESHVSHLYQQEIIEIGACIMNQYGEIESTFSSLVKPNIHKFLSPYCKNLTQINQEEINKAKIFPEVLDRFLDWADIPDVSYGFCAWGRADYNLILTDCKLHKLDSKWLIPYVDIKHQYHRNKELNKLMGLDKVLKTNGFEFEGQRHRALPDSLNLAKLVSKYVDEWVF
ncbi:MAG: exonuclease domain-containing protein [Saprospiraceae bacterium]|nr:exonuclease domain-containing protein [Candidatus Vicinibacter affinis]HQX43996.1 3'-5' exonuclease [Saprospiraceae bacterium]